MEHLRGHEITRKSFEIIRESLGELDVSPGVYEMIIRIAHTTGDVEFAKTFTFSGGAVEQGVRALENGRNVVTDVEMVRTGIRKTVLGGLGGEVYCFLSRPEVVEKGRTAASTRSALGMRQAAEVMRGGIVAVGNAPTALFELIEMIGEGSAAPALVVGVPVGFVGALESKQALAGTDIPHITNLDTRGGSTIAAAIVNGLIDLAARRDPSRE
ncbi:MAG: precorrin-8X methylmutase [Spirochaetia bacterium]